MKKKTVFLSFTALWFGLSMLSAQVTIGENQLPQNFSVLELISGNSKGLRLPQMTSHVRDSLTVEFTTATNLTAEQKLLAMGLQIFNMDNLCVETWNGGKWISTCMAGGGGVIPPSVLGCTTPVPPVVFASINLGADPTYDTPKKQIQYLDTVTYPKANGGATHYAVDGTVFGGRYQWGRSNHDYAISQDGKYILYRDNEQSVVKTADATYNPTTGQILTSNGIDATDKYVYDPDVDVNGIFDWRQDPSNSNPEKPRADLWGNGNNVEVPSSNGILSSNGNYYQSPNWVIPANNPCPSGWRVPTQDEWERICIYDCDPGSAGGNITLNLSNASYNTGKGLTWVRIKKGAAFAGQLPNLAGDYSASSPDKGGGFAIYRTSEWEAADNIYKNGTAKLYEPGAPEPLLFLPFAGTRFGGNIGTGMLDSVNSSSGYWCTTSQYYPSLNELLARILSLANTQAFSHTIITISNGNSIRCVAE